MSLVRLVDALCNHLQYSCIHGPGMVSSRDDVSTGIGVSQPSSLPPVGEASSVVLGPLGPYFLARQLINLQEGQCQPVYPCSFHRRPSVREATWNVTRLPRVRVFALRMVQEFAPFPYG